MLFAFGFGVDKNVIKVHNHKIVKFFCRNLVDIALEYGRYVGQSKKYHLVFKMAIACSDGCFLFIAFSDLHLMVGISQIKLGETLSPIKSIQ